MSTVTELTKISLANTEKGVISISKITEPYGSGSSDVVSIGISLDGSDDVKWKSHIPYENIDAVIEALTKAKNK